jgi:hypothetical protein
MSRRDRRATDPEIQKKKEEFQKQASSVLGDIPSMTGSVWDKGGQGGGWGLGNPNAKPATGQQPSVNPFLIPKAAGLTITSQTYPNNYYVEWNLSTWRAVCDQVVKMGYTYPYATLVSWVFECSPFIQSLFRALGAAMGRVPFQIVDKKGNVLQDWTKELCQKPYQKEMDKEILFSHFWGFTGLNFDPLKGQVYKYPIQDIDPINRMLRNSTFAFYDGAKFDDYANLMYIQPSCSQESFLGWMQPIARSFIQMNLNKNSWVGAGKRLAFPMLAVGYPQADGALDPVTQETVNPYRVQAENIASNIDPSKGIVFPYTLDERGNIIRSVEVEFEKPGTSASAHNIFKDFNESEKDEIREMILGGTLTASAGAVGSRALGEVQERKFESVIDDLLVWILAYKNETQLPKLLQFYKNAPDGISFAIDQTKEWSLEEMKLLSDIVTQNGKKLSNNFFEAAGIPPDFLEDAPAPAQLSPASLSADDDNNEYAIAQPKRALFGVKKKS